MPTGPAAANTRHEVVAVELVRALRGRRSQNGLSRRLGYGSNVVHRWESAQSWPTAAKFMQACERLGLDVAESYTAMFRRRPAWLEQHAPGSPEAVAAFLRDLRGATPIGEVASLAGINRFTVSRWLKGTSQPNLPQLLCMVEAESDRLDDFVATLVDPEQLPSLREGHRKLQQLRRLAYEEPWSHAVLRALQLDAHDGPCTADTAARLLALPEPRVAELLSMLEDAGQVRRVGGGWVAEPVKRVDTGADAERARGLKAAWAQSAVERLEAGAPGVFGYSLFEVSREDLERIRQLQLQYARAVQTIIAQSQPTECVGLYCVQLLDLAEDPGAETHPTDGEILTIDG